MAGFLRGSGSLIRSMGRVMSSFPVEIDMKVTIFMGSLRGREYFIGLMGRCMKESGLMVYGMVLGLGGE